MPRKQKLLNTGLHFPDSNGAIIPGGQGIPPILREVHMVHSAFMTFVGQQQRAGLCIPDPGNLQVPRSGDDPVSLSGPRNAQFP
jgi:hypothetical protein